VEGKGRSWAISGGQGSKQEEKVPRLSVEVSMPLTMPATFTSWSEERRSPGVRSLILRRLISLSHANFLMAPRIQSRFAHVLHTWTSHIHHSLTLLEKKR